LLAHALISSPSAEEADVADEKREDRLLLAGIRVREDDIEPQKGLHFVALLFRALAVLLLVLMIAQLVLGLGNPAPGATGVLLGESVRLLVFAGLLWGAGDLADLLVKSHHDLRASRILLARQAYMMRQMGVASGDLAPTEAEHQRHTDPAA
jgi:hypothetical protein